MRFGVGSHIDAEEAVDGVHRQTRVGILVGDGEEVGHPQWRESRLLQQFAAGTLFGTLVHFEEASREGPFPLERFHSALDEQNVETSAVKPEDNAVGGHAGVRILVMILKFFHILLSL